MGKLFKTIFAAVGVLGIGVIGLAFWGMSEVDRHAAMSPQEREMERVRYEAEQAVAARKRMIDNKDGHMCLDSSGQNAPVIDQLKTSLREPESFEHVSTTIGPVDSSGNHELVMRYRARNGFGGISFGKTEAIVSNSDCSALITGTESN